MLVNRTMLCLIPNLLASRICKHCVRSVVTVRYADAVPFVYTCHHLLKALGHYVRADCLL